MVLPLYDVVGQLLEVASSQLPCAAAETESNHCGNKDEDKKVVSCLRDEEPMTDLSGVKQYTIDEMHDSTKKLVKKNKKNAPMLYIVKYDETYGYITSLVRIYNPKAEAAMAPSDFSYRIKVYDFVPEESAQK